MKRLIAMLLVLGLLVTALAFMAGGPASAGSAAGEAGTGAEGSTVTTVDTSEWEAVYAEGVVDIELGATTVVNGEGASVGGDTVLITAAGVYHVSGTLTDGCIEVDAKGKVYLEFDGVDITNSAGPAVLVTDAKKVVISLVDGTTNSLADTAGGAEDTATLLTNDTLLLNGKGTLIVSGNNNEAISGDDDIIINSGTIRVTAVDDGINAHDDITINGGDVYVLAGGDGLDSNGTVNVNAGTLVCYGGTTEGEGGIDALGAFTIRGGTVIAGGNTVAPVGSDSKQGSVWVASDSIQPAGTAVLVERDGEEIISFTPDADYRTLLISSDDLIDGASYEAYLGGETGVTVVATR